MPCPHAGSIDMVAAAPILQADCVGTYIDPATGDVLQRAWSNQWLNFDTT